MKNEHRIRTSAGVQQRAREVRQEMTQPEQLLWERLCNRQLSGLKFRRQHPLGPFITDFYCAEKRMVLEIDGDIHDLQREQDEQRTRQLKNLAIESFDFGTKKSRPTSAWYSRKYLKPANSLLPKLGEGPGMRAARGEGRWR